MYHVGSTNEDKFALPKVLRVVRHRWHPARMHWKLAELDKDVMQNVVEDFRLADKLWSKTNAAFLEEDESPNQKRDKEKKEREAEEERMKSQRAKEAKEGREKMEEARRQRRNRR